MRDKAIVADFDNTVFFTDRCVRFACKEIFGKVMSKKLVRALPRNTKIKLYYLAHSKYDRYSKPNERMIKLLSKEDEKEKIILTARFLDLKSKTFNLLKKRKVNFDKVIFRELKYRKTKDEEWKRRKLRELAKKYNEINFYEDKLDNIDYIKDRLTSKNLSLFLVSKNSIKRIK